MGEPIAQVEGSAIRLGVHFKLHRRIVLEEDKYARVTLDILGCGGYLLREVGMAESESCDEYIMYIRPTLLFRRRVGIAPPRVISENHNLISRGLPGRIRTLWGDFGPPNSPGGPLRRKIDSQYAIDIAQLGSDAAIRDFAYIIRMAENLLPADGRSRFGAAYKSLSDEVDALCSRIEDTSLGPFSSTYPGNSSWQRPPTRDCCLRTFRSHVAYARATPTFPPRQASILHAYFRTGRLTGPLPQATRDALIDYWEAPRRLGEMLLPSGAVARILRADDRMSQRRETPWRETESQYFTEYEGYKSLVCEASIYAV